MSSNSDSPDSSDRPWPLSEISGASESDTDYDGPFSYSGEWHAFTLGLGVGFASVMPVPKLRQFVFRTVGLGDDQTRTGAIAEARRESWYALGGVVLGAGFGLAVVLALASLVI